jgi:WD40 repeat protein
MSSAGIVLSLLLTPPAIGLQPPAQPEKKTTPATDRYGDPLPAGANARLGTLRFRCLSDVSAIAVSPNGKWLAVSALFGQFDLFDAATGKRVRSLKTEAGILAAAFSADNRWLATGGYGAIDIWDMHTLARVATFSRPSLREKELAWVYCLAFSPDGRALVSGHGDKTVTRWDWKTGKILNHYRGHQRKVSRLALSPDGQRLISGSWDGSTRIWDVAGGKLLRTLDEDFVTLSPDGKLLVTSPPRSATLHLQPPLGGGPVRTIRVPGFFILTAAISSDGSALAVNSSSDEGHVQIENIQLFDLRGGKLQRTLSDNINGAWPILFSQAGDLVISGGREVHGNAIRFWDRRTGKRVRQFTGHENAVRAVAYLPGGKTVASAGADGTVRLWDAASGREEGRLTGPRVALWSMTVSPDGRRLACESSDRSVYIWATAGDKPPVRIRFDSHPQRVAFTPDGRWLTTGDTDGNVKLFDPGTGKVHRTLIKLPKEPTVLAYAPDGKTLAWGGYENDIRLIDTQAGRERKKLTGHTFWLRALSFSGEGRWLASGSDDGTARLWDLHTGSSHLLYEDPEPHQLHSVGAICFSPDGALVVTGHRDGGVRLWEAHSREKVADLPGHRGEVNALAFAPTGGHFVSASDDTTSLIWNLSAILSDSARLAQDWQTLWSDLAGRDARRGQRAVLGLRAKGNAAVKFVDDRLTEMFALEKAKGMARVPRLLEDLNSSAFTKREKAVRELKELGLPLLPQLRKYLKKPGSLEMQRRLERLIKAIEDQGSEQRLLLRRAIQVLEGAATSQARSILERLAESGHEAEMASAALQRLARQAKRAFSGDDE